MKIKNNKKGFALVWIVLTMSSFMIVAVSLLNYDASQKKALYIWDKKLQAMNFASEWQELVRWYVMTEVNKNRFFWWERKLENLHWNYIVSFVGWEYQLIPWNKEVIEMNDPYVVDYTREIFIEDGVNSDEKRITVSVDYGEKSKVSFETSLVNLYWD